jgi:hypothetical protein
MPRRYPMSDAQRQVLQRMAQGEAIVIRDGPYLGEDRVRFNTLWALTGAGWVNGSANSCRWEISDTGRAALAELDSSNGTRRVIPWRENVSAQ